MLFPWLKKEITDQVVQAMKICPSIGTKVGPRELFQKLFEPSPITPRNDSEQEALENILQNKEEAIQVIAAAMGLV